MQNIFHVTKVSFTTPRQNVGWILYPVSRSVDEAYTWLAFVGHVTLSGHAPSVTSPVRSRDHVMLLDTLLMCFAWPGAVILSSTSLRQRDLHVRAIAWRDCPVIDAPSGKLAAVASRAASQCYGNATRDHPPRRRQTWLRRLRASEGWHLRWTEVSWLSS